jgi:hypothetical protein
MLGLVGSFCGESISEIHLYFDTAAEEEQTFANALKGGSNETADEPFTIEPDYMDS